MLFAPYTYGFEAVVSALLADEDDMTDAGRDTGPGGGGGGSPGGAEGEKTAVEEMLLEKEKLLLTK